MEWVGVYLRDAHQRFTNNISGDLEWTLSDTCNDFVCHKSSGIANTGQIMPRRFAHTKPWLSASRIGVGCSPTKSGRDTNMLSTLHSRLALDSHLLSVELLVWAC